MQNKLLRLAIAMLLLQSCTDDTVIFEDPSQAVVLEDDSATLANSVDYSESGVLGLYSDSTLKAKRSSTDHYPMTLVANITAPSYATAQKLAATHIAMEGDYLYISYNTAGEVYAGGIDIVNIANYNDPRLTSRLYFTSADINALAFENGYVYAAGGVDSEKSVLAKENSFLTRIKVTNGRFDLSEEIRYGFQEGLIANALVVSQDGVYVSSGTNGTIAQYDKNSLEMLNEVPYGDLRSIIEKEGQFAVLDASYGVRILDGSLSEMGGFTINSDFRVGDKRTISWYGDKISVAEGSLGAGIYNSQTGQLEQYLPIMTNPIDATPDEVVTNAVAFNEDVFLMANGGAGLSLSENELDLGVVGVLELNGSINYVASKGDYIFAASGRSGLHIIKMNRPTESLEAACSNTPRYLGGSSLTVAEGENMSYSGSASLNSLTIDGELLICGTWSVSSNIVVGENALMETYGYLFNARRGRDASLLVKSGATLRMEGTYILYGDLILEENATLEFLGEDNRIWVFGEVLMANSAQVTGTFADMYNNFKQP